MKRRDFYELRESVETAFYQYGFLAACDLIENLFDGKALCDGYDYLFYLLDNEEAMLKKRRQRRHEI